MFKLKNTLCCHIGSIASLLDSNTLLLNLQKILNWLIVQLKSNNSFVICDLIKTMNIFLEIVTIFWKVDLKESNEVLNTKANKSKDKFTEESDLNKLQLIEITNIFVRELDKLMSCLFNQFCQCSGSNMELTISQRSDFRKLNEVKRSFTILCEFYYCVVLFEILYMII